MFFGRKIGRLVIVAVFIWGVSLTLLNAAGWDEQAIPVPQGAEQVNSENRMISGSEFSFTYYTSSQDIGAIQDFYRHRLPNLGWKEKNLAAGLDQAQGVKMDASFRGFLGQNLVFEKESDMLIITFLPEGAYGDRKTRFTLSRGKIDLQKELPKDTNFAPELLTQPKKDVAPVYPGASLISLSEQEHSLKATYFTRDDIERVIAFYKEKMADYGWYLTNERPLEKVEPGQGGADDISKQCPTCPKDAATLAQSVETWWAELNFSNERQNTCNVVLSHVVTTQGMPASLQMTTILVHYEEKK